MPKPRPDYVRGGFYHFYNRGAHRVSIFRERDNYSYVLRKMKSYVRSFFLAPIVYCLLPNHYHWLIRQDGDIRAGLLPQQVFNAYSKAYNRRYGHSGTLFEGTYKVEQVLSESHLLHLCRYIHANPVIHDIVEEVDLWPYSNYPEWVGERPGSLIDRGFVEAHFPTADTYRAFVPEYSATRRLPDALGDPEPW